MAVIDKPSMFESETSPANGLLPGEEIRGLIARGLIEAERGVEADQVQPASLDLRLGARGFRLRASFLPGPGAQAAGKAAELALHEFRLDRGSAVLETGCVYLIELAERVCLPRDVAALASPKSSTGRIDVFTRLVCDFGGRFDRLAPGYRGPLYLEVNPQSFGLIVREGSRLAQLRFRRGKPAYDNYRLRAIHRAAPLIEASAPPEPPAAAWPDSTRHPHISQGLVLSIDLSGAGGIAGYRAKRHAPLIDADSREDCAVEDFWEAIAPPAKRRLILDPGEFYILASREAVRIPASHAAEMTPFDPQIGEFRAHYAGFFDPGFGLNAGGAKAVLEIRSREAPFIIEDGQAIGRLVFERLTRPADLHYDRRGDASYRGQGLSLSRHFRVAAGPERRGAGGGEDQARFFPAHEPPPKTQKRAQ